MQQNRDYVLIYLNGKRLEIKGAQAFMTLSDFLRETHQLTGTKVVCAEGDCGACTVLVGAVKPNADVDSVQYQSINSCIQFMHGLDCSHVITIEGLNIDLNGDSKHLHPVQQAMVEAQATQCGFCTPGFVMAAAGMLEAQDENKAITPQNARNHLTGNLCRCTGYQSIINAMVGIKRENNVSIKATYHDQETHDDLLSHTQVPVFLSAQKHRFVAPIDLPTAATEMTAENARVFAASTDLGVQHNKGLLKQQQVISLNLIEAMHCVSQHSDHVSIGARVTLSTLENHLSETYPEWGEFMHLFASPQIKNNGTLIGNIANGSPIGDHLPFLLAMDAELIIQSSTQQRSININDFYLGYRQKDLAENELITHVNIPLQAENCFLKLYKVSQRRDLDISCVAAAFKMVFNADDTLVEAAIALGGVAATALRLPEIEQQLLGLQRKQIISPSNSKQVAALIAQSVQPLSDVRGSAAFRHQLVHNLYQKYTSEMAEELANEREVAS